MKKIILNFTFVCLSILLMGFKKEEYKVIDKEIEGRKFYFEIPNSFCEYDMYSPQVFQFVKCYEIELMKEGELSFFSERIFIGFEENDERIQNMTDGLFAKIQRNNYINLPKEKKKEYFYDSSYPLNNLQNSRIVDNSYIFNRKGYNKDGDKFTAYEANVFLNKRNFVIGWTQYLTKKEKLLSLKKFSNFIKKNKQANNYSKIVYDFGGKQITISKPKFDDFINYTDIKSINNGEFNGFFISPFKKMDKNQDMKIFKISIIPTNLDIKKSFENFKNNDKSFNDIELINYKNTDFIKITRDNTVMYICYIKFSDNTMGILSLEINKKDNYKKNKEIKYIYKYMEQLIKENS